jgi:hypothetical protein
VEIIQPNHPVGTVRWKFVHLITQIGRLGGKFQYNQPSYEKRAMSKLYLHLATHIYSMQPSQPPKKLLDQVREAIRLKHYSYRTKKTYVQWIRRYILFHDKRHPKDIGVPEIEAFLTHLAVTQEVAAATQNQALSALFFLYKQVLGQSLEGRIEAIKAKPSRKLPTVLTPEEVAVSSFSRYPHNTRTAGSQGCENNRDLHYVLNRGVQLYAEVSLALEPLLKRPLPHRAMRACNQPTSCRLPRICS